MKIYVLPTDLNIDQSSPIQVHNYRNHGNFDRNKVSLTKHVISFLLHGEKEVIGDYHSTRIDNNSFLIMKSGHCLMTERLSNSSNSYKSILLFFTNDIVIDFLEKHAHSVSKPEPSSFHIYHYDSYIHHFVESLEQLSGLSKHLQDQLLNAKFEEIMLYLCQKEGNAFLYNIIQQYDGTTKRLKHIVENNRLKKLSLQELSFLCNMSVSTFKREFYKQYQQTPIKWFQERRLEHSAFLLSTQKKRPIELFEEAGYQSLSTYIHAFKEKYGITPKQFQLK